MQFIINIKDIQIKKHICSNIAAKKKKIASTTTARLNTPLYYKKGN
jgi:hypothetical protein